MCALIMHIHGSPYSLSQSPSICNNKKSKKKKTQKYLMRCMCVELERQSMNTLHCYCKTVERNINANFV